ncbi:hypothetical protein [Enhydrobacter sp.]|jgi:uncharacterized BrkB/YihY/UPF0761 family membrane protein|uniref:hypothetical protein n=1 Tax=Enhydrobacter sp. TaxID=1894999 RepID=UPI0026040BD6|nr:hypothetical protein [Enhydrobacter sp.]WIM12845.1 MAG: hypothetical protein OJF58_003808 [Enhydrobacter sp.]
MTVISNGVRLPAQFRLARREPQRLPATVLWQWVLRLALPLLTALGGLVLYWIWFDNVYGRHWSDTVGGSALAVTLVLVGVWSIGAWFSDAA